MSDFQKLMNLKQHIVTTERQYEKAVRYAALLKRDLLKSKKKLAKVQEVKE